MVGKEEYMSKLKELLYELKQFSRQWYKRLINLSSLKVHNKSIYDPCVYQEVENGELVTCCCMQTY